MKSALIKFFKLNAKRYKLNAKSGFTLIELLVVIGILGILAAALVATIDPFEQLEKADDANTKNTLVEFLNGNVRYYTTHSAFPWQSTDTTYASCSGLDASGTFTSVQISDGTSTNTPMENCIAALTADNELKSAFTSSNVLPQIYVSYNASGELVGCFQPKSKSQQNDANTKYNRDGVVNTTKTCTATTNPNNGCYWCTR